MIGGALECEQSSFYPLCHLYEILGFHQFIGVQGFALGFRKGVLKSIEGFSA